jgi:hypothetical protein
MTDREALERGRRRALHAQIGALQTKLAQFPHPLPNFMFARYYRLYNKVRRLERELEQMPLPIARAS